MSHLDSLWRRHLGELRNSLMVYSYDLLWCLRSTYTPAPPSKNSQVQVPLYWSALQWSDNFPAKSSSRSHLWCLLKDTAWRWKPATSKSPREKKEKKQKQKIIASEHWLKNTVAIWIPIGRPVGNRTRPTLVKGKCHRHCATIDVTLLTRRTHEIHSSVCPPHFVRAGAYFARLFPAHRNCLLPADTTASNTRTTKYYPG